MLDAPVESLSRPTTPGERPRTMSELVNTDAAHHGSRWAVPAKMSRWLEVMLDSDAFWIAGRWALLALGISIVFGPLIVIAANWPVISSYRSVGPSGSEARAHAVAREPVAAVTSAPVEAPLPASVVFLAAAVQGEDAVVREPQTPPATQSPMAPVAEPQTAPAADLQTPLVIFEQQTGASAALGDAAEPTAVPGDAAPPSVEAEWQKVLPRIDRLWGSDTRGVLSILTEFHERFPDDAPARDKLYATLLASSDEHAQAGDAEAAGEELTRAVALEPGRSEAQNALAALTVTPTPTTVPETGASVAGVQAAAGGPVPETVRSQSSTSTPVAARAGPTPISRAVVAVPTPRPPASSSGPQIQAAPPTPTKVPFRPAAP
jgi:hypothetical protein